MRRIIYISLSVWGRSPPYAMRIIFCLSCKTEVIYGRKRNVGTVGY